MPQLFQNLLLVEDEAIIAMDAEECLEAAGHHVGTVVGSLREALRALQAANDGGGRAGFDGALIDFNLPDGNSLPIVKWLDEHQVPFAVVTSESPRFLAERGIAQERVFQKPIDYASIAERLAPRQIA